MPLNTAGNVALANAALALLGADSLVSFSDPAELGGNVARIFAATVRARLASYPWRFTLRKAQLSRLAEAPATEWQYQHQLPAGMLALRALFPSNTPGAAPVAEYERFENQVLSNQTELWADYQAEIVPELWPATFYLMVQNALASDLAQLVTGSSSLAEFYAVKAYGTPGQGGAGGLTGEARRLDAQQQPPQRLHSFPLIQARLGGGRYR